MCNDWVSFCLWIYTRAPSVFIDTAVNLLAATGFVILLRDRGVLRVSVKTEYLYEYYAARTFMSHEWTHIVTTWGLGRGICVYIDGCEMEKSSYAKRNRTNDIVKYPNFLIGKKNMKTKIRICFWMNYTSGMMSWHPTKRGNHIFREG